MISLFACLLTCKWIVTFPIYQTVTPSPYPDPPPQKKWGCHLHMVKAHLSSLHLRGMKFSGLACPWNEAHLAVTLFQLRWPSVISGHLSLWGKNFEQGQSGEISHEWGNVCTAGWWECKAFFFCRQELVWSHSCLRYGRIGRATQAWWKNWIAEHCCSSCILSNIIIPFYSRMQQY